jgi:hypothetical protein
VEKNIAMSLQNYGDFVVWRQSFSWVKIIAPITIQLSNISFTQNKECHNWKVEKNAKIYFNPSKLKDHDKKLLRP